MVGAGLSLSAQPPTGGDFGFKQCGSSIANYSDHEMPPESFQEYQGGPFLQESHLVHPPPAGAGKLTFRSRDIRGVPAPVFVPQQRNHRVNGLFQDSSRGITPQGYPPQQQPSGAFDSSMRSTVRNNTDTQRPPVSQFSAHRRQPSQFEFSHLASDDGNSYELQPMSNQTPQRQRNGRYLPRPPFWLRLLTHSTDSYVTNLDQYQYSPEYSSSPPSAAYLGNRQRGNTFESSTQDSDQSFRNHSFSFDLIPLEQAQRRQAERRASGRDEGGHLLNVRDQAFAVARNVTFATAGSHAGSPLLTPSAVATPPTQGRVSRFVPRAFTQFSSPFGGRESNTNGKTLHRKLEIESQKVASPPEREVPLILSTTVRMVAHSDTRPTISTINGSDVTISTVNNPDGTSYRIFDPPPRLYPWDTRHRRLAAQKSTDRSLQAMTRGDLRNPMNDAQLQQALLWQEAWLSQDAQKRRWRFFFVVAILSVLPFISPIAFWGGFNSALSWHTHGEVDRFSVRQRRILLAEMIISWLLFVAITVFVIIANVGHR